MNKCITEREILKLYRGVKHTNELIKRIENSKNFTNQEKEKIKNVLIEMKKEYMDLGKRKRN